MIAYIHWLRNELDSDRWSADPDQPCLLYKLYEHTQHYHLDTAIPLRLGLQYLQAQAAQSTPLPVTASQQLSWLLYYTHGLTRIQRTEGGKPTPSAENQALPFSPGRHTGPKAQFSPSLGRVVPSGGGLHPLEIYLALNETWGIPCGIYHYDCAHHRLDLLREGDFFQEIFACLPKEARQPCSAVLLTTVYIQKNHQKYTELSYNLQSLDAGIVLAQAHFVARCLGLSLQTHVNALDGPLHQLLGLNPEDENIYALATLTRPSSALSFLPPETPTRESNAPQSIQGTLLGNEAPQPFPLRPRSVLLQHLYRASLLDSLPESTPVSHEEKLERVAGEDYALPEPGEAHKQDIAQLLLHRHTGFNAIETQAISSEQLSGLLTPLRQPSQLSACDLWISCVVSRVTGLPAGVYRYQPHDHRLILIQNKHLFATLTRITTAKNIHPSFAPVNLFFGANYQRAQQLYGARALRLLGIEVGRMIQALSLSAMAYDLTSHTHLSFAVEGTRTFLLHNTDEDGIVLASMMIGRQRKSQAGLFEAIWY